MDEIPQDSVNVLETLQNELLVRYVVAAASTLFLYDVLVHLDVEIESIWASLDPRKPAINRARSLFSLLYLAQRYSPMLDIIAFNWYLMLGTSNSKSCGIAFSLSFGAGLLGMHLSELMLGLRIWAVWALKPFIIVILIVVQVGSVIPMAIFLEKSLKGMHFLKLHLPGGPEVKGCFYLAGNRDLFVCWILFMIHDSIAFALMAIPGVLSYRSGGRSNLVKTIYRDGVIYYTLIFVLSVVNVIVILVLPSNLTIIITPFERVLYSIFSSHAILHIRQQTSVGDVQMIDFTGGAVSTRGGLMTNNSEIEFASRTVRSAVEREG